MDWVDRMNDTLDVLEANLREEIDPVTISRRMACPYAVFTRMFAPLMGVSLAEYLRRRRLTCAAEDLCHTQQRIVDIAVRYGYDSADAFTAAFKRQHGVTPQEARAGEVSLCFYPRLHFTMTIMGAQAMDYHVSKRKGFQVMGVRRVTPYGGGTWAVVKRDGSAARLAGLCGHPCDLGLCFGFNAEGHNDYLCGVLWPDEPLPGWDAYQFPDAQWLTFTAEGSISSGVLAQAWKRIYGEFLPQSGYLPLDLPTIEHYCLWDEAADTCHVEIQMPVTRA